MQIYLVGGAVRDALLGLPVCERDWVVVGSTPEEMISLGFRQKRPNFPVFLHPESGEEHALARVERKIAGGHTGFEFDISSHITLTQDLQRRDLTINAIAMDKNNNIVDPYHGRRDLDARRLAHVSPAFAEDPLRVLRLARFLATFADFGFSVDEQTQDLACSMAQRREFTELSLDRVWRETRRSLATRRPWLYFEFLRAIGGIEHVLPDLPWHDIRQEGDSATTQKASCDNDATPAQVVATLDHLFGDNADHCAKALQSAAARWPLSREDKTLLDCVALAYRQSAALLDGNQALLILNQMQAFRRPAIFQRTVDIAGTISRLRPLVDSLRRANEACASVDIGGLREQGLEGRELGEAISQQRLSAVIEALRR